MNLEFWSTVSLCLTTILTNLLIFRFYAEVYQIKVKTKSAVIILWVISTAIYILVNRTVSYFNLPLYLNSVYGLIHINVWSVILCKQKLKRKILFNIIYFLILFVADFLSVSVWAVIESINLQGVLTNDRYVIFSCALNLLLMFLLCNIFIYVLSRKELTKIKTTQILLLLLLTVFEISVVYSYAFKISSYLDGIIAIIMLVGFLSLNFAITYIIEMMAHFYEDKMKLQLMRKQNELQLANYMETDRKYQEARKIIHDMKKHLYTLGKLINIDNDKAQNYIKLIEDGMDSLGGVFHCRNKILSIVMGQKISVAENENIKVKTDVEDLALEFIDDVDITAIFANLWDNAIDACCKLKTEDRFINVIIGRSNGFIMICFENSYNGIIKKEDSKIKSVKKDHTGWGLSIIKSTAEKYNGIFFTEYDDKVFEAKLMIPVSK